MKLALFWSDRSSLSIYANGVALQTTQTIQIYWSDHFTLLLWKPEPRIPTKRDLDKEHST